MVGVSKGIYALLYEQSHTCPDCGKVIAGRIAWESHQVYRECFRGKVLKRSRKRGFRLPKGAVVVDRTSRWGNPERVAKGADDFTRRVALAEYCRYLIHNRELMAQLPGLAGRDVADWCHEWDGQDYPPMYCHADILVAASVLDNPYWFLVELREALLNDCMGGSCNCFGSCGCDRGVCGCPDCGCDKEGTKEYGRILRRREGTTIC